MSNCRRKLRVLPLPADYVSLRSRQDDDSNDVAAADVNADGSSGSVAADLATVKDNNNDIPHNYRTATRTTAAAMEALTNANSNKLLLTETKSLELNIKHDIGGSNEDYEDDDISK